MVKELAPSQMAHGGIRKSVKLKGAEPPAVPKHIGIIMDGNRRFAKMLGEQAWKGHAYGREKLEQVLDWCRELNLKTLTVWAFSRENFEREPEEVKILMNLFEQGFLDLAKDERMHKFKIKLNVVGDLTLFPQKVRDAVKFALDATKNYSDFSFNIVMGYGGRQEILDAVSKITAQMESGELAAGKITEELIESNMYSKDLPDVDLVIRTSGEQRTSGFLMWKSDYAEYYFCDKLWPAFEKEDLVKAIVDYSERKRRFGK
ncbi:MAG: di-trans,poly-cis-decaprenylcistransferase [DPANN group archaeon]|nr:di-trans,poly-cis-decaprenylcistransferase [DPANN group archaeon]